MTVLTVLSERLEVVWGAIVYFFFFFLTIWVVYNCSVSSAKEMVVLS